MSPQPGDVWLAELGMGAKTRPLVIVLRFDPDAPRALVIKCTGRGLHSDGSLSAQARSALRRSHDGV